MEYVIRARRTGAFLVLMIVILCAGTLRAGNLLTATPGAVSISCNTATGPGAATAVLVKPAAALTTNTIAVSVTPMTSGLVVTPPASTTLNSANQADGLTYSVSLGAGCAGAATKSASIRFSAAGTPDVSVVVNMTVTASMSALVAPPVTITCAKPSGPPLVYTPGPPQTVTVTSAAAGGTPFTVDSTGNPAWLSITPIGGGTANATGVALAVTAVAPCGNFAAGSANTASIRLRNQPAPDVLVPVTLQILGASPLTALPKAPSLAYTKDSSTAASVDVAINGTSSQSQAFSMDSASLPAWLTVDALSGTTSKTLHFSTTSVADTLAPGVYTASVRLKTTGFSDLLTPFSLVVSNPAPKLTVAEGISRNLSWTVGQPAPTAYITVASTDAPIPYTITTAGEAGPVISSNLLKGLAYSYSAPIPVSFDAAKLAGTPPGSMATGAVTFTWGNPATTLTVKFSIAVQPAGAALLSISPSSLPTSSPGQKFTVALLGSGFVASADPAQQTFVGIVSGGSLAADASITATVLNPSNIIVTIKVPDTPDPYLPFSPAGAGGVVVLGVCNPAGTTCSVPTGTVQFAIGANPVIQSVTSASAFLQVSPPMLPVVAPFDMISIFGTNFCGSGGCDHAQVLYGTPDPVTARYPTALSPDLDGSQRRLLTVVFQTHGSTPALIAKAPLLFATSSQINLFVPTALAAYVGKSVDIVVAFGQTGSAPFAVNIVAANPGIFTVGSAGQGEGAILGFDSSVITSGNEGGMRAKPSDSDIVEIYMTGLGVPDGKADNASAGTAVWPADCLSTASYLAALNVSTSGTWASLDGALIPSSLFNSGRLPPCLQSAAAIPTVTIGGQPAAVTYAGWVSDSVAGLYQVNVRLPGSNAGPFTSTSSDVISPPLTAPARMPVTVTARGRSSQPGVTIWVTPRLKVTPPSTLMGKAGVPWPSTGNLVTASGGTPSYHYAVTSGVLPPGLALDPVSGAISGTTAAPLGSYLLTITATDSADIPVSDTVTFTLNVQ